ncbi:MAG: hypothetical protein U9R25_16265 [Chloroflexota bacterium]|nr:hypothetical protein [Chloroflexota bacterium]
MSSGDVVTQSRLRTRSYRTTLFLASALCLLAMLLVACVLPEELPAPRPINITPTPIVQPEHCTGDGAIQSWILLPDDPLSPDLLTAYANGQIIEFQASLLATDEDPVNLPHRSFTLGEVAEGITLTLDYLGDPPPLAVNQSYRMIAWTDLIEPLTRTMTTAQLSPTATITSTVTIRRYLPQSHGYELQVYDDHGLLFLGATDVDLLDDSLLMSTAEADSDCPVISTIDMDGCRIDRQVMPLLFQWQDKELTLYPGEDGQMRQGAAVYQVSVFRNRVTEFDQSTCPDYYENTRSIRVERLFPLPTAPLLPDQPLTVTVPLTTGQPLTTTIPLTGGTP